MRKIVNLTYDNIMCVSHWLCKNKGYPDNSETAQLAHRLLDEYLNDPCKERGMSLEARLNRVLSFDEYQNTYC